MTRILFDRRGSAGFTDLRGVLRRGRRVRGSRAGRDHGRWRQQGRSLAPPEGNVSKPVRDGRNDLRRGPVPVTPYPQDSHCAQNTGDGSRPNAALRSQFRWHIRLVARRPGGSYRTKVSYFLGLCVFDAISPSHRRTRPGRRGWTAAPAIPGTRKPSNDCSFSIVASR
jgi:hypothetical protein